MLLLASQLGVPVPSALYVDPDQAIIVVEKLEGKLLKQLIDEEGSSPRVVAIVEKLGYYVGLMHEHDLVHGDLTTSNVVVRNTKPYLIDFGLAERSRDELDKAVDVHLFLRSLESTHPEHVTELYEAFLRGYSRARGKDKAKTVANLVERIRVMGRYVEEARRVAMVWGGRT
jgi:TP53 regulating kinase-like protein